MMTAARLCRWRVPHGQPNAELASAMGGSRARQGKHDTRGGPTCTAATALCCSYR